MALNRARVIRVRLSVYVPVMDPLTLTAWLTTYYEPLRAGDEARPQSLRATGLAYPSTSAGIDIARDAVDIIRGSGVLGPAL